MRFHLSSSDSTSRRRRASHHRVCDKARGGQYRRTDKLQYWRLIAYLFNIYPSREKRQESTVRSDSMRISVRRGFGSKAPRQGPIARRGFDSALETRNGNRLRAGTQVPRGPASAGRQAGQSRRRNTACREWSPESAERGPGSRHATGPVTGWKDWQSAGDFRPPGRLRN